MLPVIAGSLLLSVLHALIPSHWLPVVAIGRRENWSYTTTLKITVLAGLAHAVSTVMIGIIVAIVGQQLSKQVSLFTTYIAPVILVVIGLYYIYQHSRHKHFHVHTHAESIPAGKVVWGLTTAMFLSPCLEIEAYFLVAGGMGWTMVVTIAVLYTIVTVLGMIVWVSLIYRGLSKLNWHSFEHSSGIITGLTLIVTGIVSFYIS